MLLYLPFNPHFSDICDLEMKVSACQLESLSRNDGISQKNHLSGKWYTQSCVVIQPHISHDSSSLGSSLLLTKQKKQLNLLQKFQKSLYMAWKESCRVSRKPEWANYLVLYHTWLLRVLFKMSHYLGCCCIKKLHMGQFMAIRLGFKSFIYI